MVESQRRKFVGDGDRVLSDAAQWLSGVLVRERIQRRQCGCEDRMVVNCKYGTPGVPDLGRARLKLLQGGLEGSHIGQGWYESQSMVQQRGVGEQQGRYKRGCLEILARLRQGQRAGEVCGAAAGMQHFSCFADCVGNRVCHALARQIGVPQTVSQVRDRAFAPCQLVLVPSHRGECDCRSGERIPRRLRGNRAVPQVQRIAKPERQ